MSDLDLLREIGQRVRQPAFGELLDTRRRRTRRVHMVTACTAAAAIAGVGVLAATGYSTRAEAPPAAPSQSPSPTPTPTPTESFEVPTGQQTIMAEIRPGEVYGFDVVTTVTNTSPEHLNETSLSATVTVPTDSSYVVYECRAHDAPTWIAYAAGDLVSDSPGAAHDGWTFRACLPDDPMSLILHADLPEAPSDRGDESKTVRMFAMAPPSSELEDCLASEPGGDCPLPEPITATDAEFGFRVYAHRWAPPPLQLVDVTQNDEPYTFEAVSSIDEVAWLVDRAVVAAPDAARLAFELPASDSEYLIDVYDGNSPGFWQCWDDHAGELPDYETTDHNVYEAALDKVCGVDFRFVVDGATVTPDEDPHASGHFMELGALLSPGVDHRVEVEVVRGDPRNVRYAVVARISTPMP